MQPGQNQASNVAARLALSLRGNKLASQCLFRNACLCVRCAQPEAVRKAEKQLPRALDAYRRVLERAEGNAFAANGVGAVLAEQGHVGAARAVFAQVRFPRVIRRNSGVGPVVAAELAGERKTSQASKKVPACTDAPN